MLSIPMLTWGLFYDPITDEIALLKLDWVLALTPLPTIPPLLLLTMFEWPANILLLLVLIGLVALFGYILTKNNSNPNEIRLLCSLGLLDF